MEKEIAQLESDIKNYENLLSKGGLTLTEQTTAELYIKQWKKDLKFLKKELKENNKTK